MLTIATCLWDANEHSLQNSRCFDESWVEKLYRGFGRNLTRRFRFVCFTDRMRQFGEKQIEQELLLTQPPDYGCYIEPFRVNGPLIVAGLDTVIVGNIDHLAAYCLKPGPVALPRDPYQPGRSINAIALVPEGHDRIYADWRGENDMEWLRTFPWRAIDDLFPGEVISLKAHKVRDKGLQRARIVYCHGFPKMHELGFLPWVRENWR